MEADINPHFLQLQVHRGRWNWSSIFQWSILTKKICFQSYDQIKRTWFVRFFTPKMKIRRFWWKLMKCFFKFGYNTHFWLLRHLAAILWLRCQTLAEPRTSFRKHLLGWTSQLSYNVLWSSFERKIRKYFNQLWKLITWITWALSEPDPQWPPSFFLKSFIAC